MTATNHALTGAIIGAAVRQPWLALPLAFMSHYVLDAIPHFGVGKGFIATRVFKRILVADALLCLLLVAVLAAFHPAHWLQLSACAFLATSPDLFWINSFRYATKNQLDQWHPNWHSRFASRIQWFERPIGALVEIVWCGAAITILYAIIK